MLADRYFGNSPIEIILGEGDEEKRYWRIKTTLPGTEPIHICGSQEFDVPQDEYTQYYRGPGCGNPPKERYRYELSSDDEGDVYYGTDAEKQNSATGRPDQAAEKLDDVVGKRKGKHSKD